MKFEKYFKKRTDKIDLLLKKTARTFTPWDFHQLRIEIKKINALFIFIAFSEKDFKKRSVFKPYKLIFTAAGKVREYQMEEAVFKKHFGQKKFTQYQTDLKKSELLEKRKFFTGVNASLKKDLKRSNKIALSFLKKLKTKDLSEYLKMKRVKIKKTLNKKQLKQKEIHQLRKDLKICYYNAKILGKRSKYSLVKMEKLQELLGKWHDGIVMNNHLKKMIKFLKQNSNESKHLKKIRKEISYKTKTLYKSIDNERRNFI
jgi:CHAD domain-containing protein